MNLQEALDLAEQVSPMPVLAGQALRVLHAEIERLRAMPPAVPHGYALVSTQLLRAWGKLDEVRSMCVYPDAQGEQPDRHHLQQQGAHPAPCARKCAAAAFEIEIRNAHAAADRLRKALAGMDAQPEPCESALPDCGPAAVWDTEGVGVCTRCARELGWQQ